MDQVEFLAVGIASVTAIAPPRSPPPLDFLPTFQPLFAIPPPPTPGAPPKGIVGPTDDRIPTIVSRPLPPPEILFGTSPPPPLILPTLSYFDNFSPASTGSIFTNSLEQEQQVLDNSKPFIQSILFESQLQAILPRQITPSKDDINACTSFWNEWPLGYNGSQTSHCFPLSAVGRIQTYFEDIRDPILCTGAVIGQCIVLTAAHCFTYAQEILGKNWTNVEFTPGQFGDYKPFGSFQNGVVFTMGEKFNSLEDFAIIKFSEDIGNLTGWLGVDYNECGNQTYDVTIAGYADDNIKQSDEMWTSKCDGMVVDSCTNGNSSGTFLHECDTNEGTSGAPLFANNVIVGVHQGGQKNVGLNSATFISRQLMDFIATHYN